MDAVRITSNQLESLPMLDRDYLSALSQLFDAGALGSEGATVIVDGLPSDDHNIPLSEIEEIRINKNPYSAEFMRPGKGRIEIITKSGSAKYHGSLYFGFRDYRFDARNAFAVVRPPERRRQFEGHLSGPIYKGKKNTFSLTGIGNAPPALGPYTISGPSGTVAPFLQPSVGLTLADPYPVALTGVLALSDTSDAFPIDPAVQFVTGGRSLPFTIAANTTQALFANGQNQVRLLFDVARAFEEALEAIVQQWRAPEANHQGRNRQHDQRAGHPPVGLM